jgi:hypothetical protein
MEPRASCSLGECPNSATSPAKFIYCKNRPWCLRYSYLEVYPGVLRFFFVLSYLPTYELFSACWEMPFYTLPVFLSGFLCPGVPHFSLPMCQFTLLISWSCVICFIHIWDHNMRVGFFYLCISFLLSCFFYYSIWQFIDFSAPSILLSVPSIVNGKGYCIF